MPIPEERLYKSGKLNRWFAASSLLMTGSLLWMIWVDYNRPWHEFQDDYFVTKAALAHFDFLDSQQEVNQKQLVVAKKRETDAIDLHGKTGEARRVKLQAELGGVDLEFRKANAPYSAAKQLLDVSADAFERIRGEHGDAHARTKLAKTQLEAERSTVAELLAAREKWNDKKRELIDDIKEIEKPLKDARKAVRELEMIAEAAAEKDSQFRGVLQEEGLIGGLPIVKAIINAPLLDFTAPKNTPSRRQVNQLVLPEIRQQLNYLESYTTDRCTTCHVAIDDPEFSMETLARRLEAAIPAINEELVRKNKAPVPVPAAPILGGANAPKLAAGAVVEFWSELSSAQRKEYFAALLESVNRYMRATGRKELQLEQPLLAHPDLELYVSVDSAHPKSQMGCTVCHEGNSQETDFVLAAHSPPTHEVEERWKEEYYVRRMGLPQTTFETVEHYWSYPMLQAEHTQASCTKCHTQATDISRFNQDREGERINQGLYLFSTLGCINCHAVESLAGARRVGPSLMHIGSKLNPSFAEPWIFFPQKFRPSTRMPHFFQQENNRTESANRFDTDPALRTESEVAAMAKYLFAVSQPWTPLTPPEGVVGDAARGRVLFRQTGCLACHAVIQEDGTDWISQDIVARKGTEPKIAEFQAKGMGYVEQVRYAMEHFADEQDGFLHPESVRDPATELTRKITFPRVGPELSGIGSKVSASWLYSWVMQPSHYWEDTKMPSLRLAPAEAADISAYLMTLKNNSFTQAQFVMDGARQAKADELIMTLLMTQRSEAQSRAVLSDANHELTDSVVAMLTPSLGKQPAYDLVSPMSPQDKKLMFLGNKMISHYGCYACHKIAGFEEATPPGTELTKWAERPISQIDFAFYDHAFHDMRHKKEAVYGRIYPADAAELNDWSPGENPKEQITHTHAAFAKHKLLNPRIWDREKIKRPYDKLKMPNYYLTEDESNALTTYLMSRRSPRVSDRAKVDYENNAAGPIAKGRALTRELNCVGCHEIEDNAPTVQQYFQRKMGGKSLLDSVNAPPRLWGEGAKVQHNWLHKFLRDVVPLRPWLSIRMPSYTLTNEQSTTLVEYFAALSQTDAKTMRESLDPVLEHIRTHAAASPNSDATRKESDGAEGKTSWFFEPALRKAAKRLRNFAVERRLVRSVDVDLLRADPKKQEEGHRRVLERLEFMANLYNVAYPFVEPPRTAGMGQRYQAGQSLLNDIGCLKCHVLGPMESGPAKNTDQFVQTYRLDAVQGEGESAIAFLNGVPFAVGAVVDGHKIISAGNTFYDTGDVETKAVVEGSNAAGVTERVVLQAASAPNLALAHQRLRRDWVQHFLANPDWIQPGTKMPSNFAEGKSPFAGDPRYPGSTLDHIHLLVDFLYEAGSQNHRIPLVKSIAAAAEEFDDGKPKAAEEFKD